MAEIVILNKWRSEKPRRPQIRIGETEDAGRIVLFTGVRYERFETTGFEAKGFDEQGDPKAENHAVGAE